MQTGKPLTNLLLGLWAGLTACGVPAGDFDHNPETQAFITEMVERHQFDRNQLEALFGDARKRDDILKAIARPAESKPWYEYRPIFMTQSRIDGGVDFWRARRRWGR